MATLQGVLTKLCHYLAGEKAHQNYKVRMYEQLVGGLNGDK